MKCPKCGYERQPRDHVFVPGTECPACGVVYSKYGSDEQDTGENGGEKSTGTIKKPSPVHEDSLKQARERVEKRLRAKSAAHLPDEHREQTMERAKLIVSEGLRKRQAEWQLKKVPAENEATLQAEGSAINESAPMVDTEQAQMQTETQEPPFDEEAYGPDTFSTPAGQAIESMDQSQAVASAMMADAPAGRGNSDGLIRLLPTVAWIILAAGLIGAVLSWTTMGRVYAGPAVAVSPTPSGGGHIPVALLLGFAYLAIGVLGFAFFWVSSMINGQLKEIRQLLTCSFAIEDQSTSSTGETQ